jgi:hypothetical protein
VSSDRIEVTTAGRGDGPGWAEVVLGLPLFVMPLPAAAP